MKSKVLRSLMSLCLLVVGIGNAWGATIVGGINYELKSSLGTYWAEVVAINGGYSGNLVIPENISAQDNWGVRRSYKVSVIAAGAFQNCTELTSVVVPNVVDKIEANAFSGCSKLSDVYITWQSLPNNVPASAFLTGEDNDITIHCPYGCSRDSYYDSSWGRKTYLDEASHVTVSSEILSNQVYYVINSSDNKNFFETIIDLVTLGIAPTEGRTQDKVKKNQFGASNVASKNPGTQAGGIGTLTFDGNVTKVGDNAFKDCYGSEKIFIPSTVQSIGNNAFQNCTGLTTLNSTGSGDAGIVIPNNVNSIGQSAFENCVSISSVTITNANTTLAEGAFKKCVSLSSVSLPEGLTAIPAEAFMNCSSLSEITIPSTVTSIGENAFAGTNISTVVIPASVTQIDANAFPATVTEVTFAEGRAEGAPIEFDKGVFVSPANIQSVTLTSGVTLSDESEFVGFNALNTVVLPSDLTTIPATTFKNCSNLATCEIPSSVTTIGTEAFAGTKLASVSISESVTTMGNGAFKGCASLTEVTLPEGMTTIPAETFMNCSALTEVTIPSTVTTIGKDAFAGTNITKIVIPASVTNIAGTFPASVKEVVFAGERTTPLEFNQEIFADPSKITSVSLATGVKLNEGAFDGFTALEQVSLPGDLKTIYDNMFKDCKTLKDVKIPSVETIGASAFEGCTSLTNVVLPENLETISARAFYGCENLESCNIPENVSTIGTEAFAGTKLTSVTIPASVTEIAAGAFPESVAELTFADRAEGAAVLEMENAAFTNPNLTAVTVGNGVVLTDAALGSTQVSSVTISNNMRDVAESPLAGLSNLSTVIISNAKDGEGNSVVTSIGNNVFNGIESLTSVNLNDGLESIGEGAFAGTGLTSVDLTNVSTVGAGAFAETKLESVSIPSGITLGEGVFAGTTTLASATLAEGMTTIPASTFEGCSALASANIPSTVETIGTEAFAGTGLTSVTIPASVDNIEAGAFSGSLTSVVIADQSDEGGLTIADGAFAGNEGLTTVTIGNGVTLKDATFGGTAEIPAPVNTVIISTNMADVETSPIVGLNSVKTVTISEGVETIGNNVFNGCDDLTVVNIPNTVTSMGTSAFEGCTGLTTVDLSDNMTAILDATFKGCSNLTTCDIPEKVETIGFEAFAGTKVNNVVLPASVDEIGESAFANNTSLTNITLNEGLETIGENAFAGTGLTSIEIPASVAEIGAGAFQDVTSLTSVTLAEGVKTIGDNAFAGTGLTEVSVPGSVATIGAGAFSGAENLTSVTIAEGVQSIGKYAFDGTGLTEVSLPASVTSIGTDAIPTSATIALSSVPDGIANLSDNTVDITLTDASKVSEGAALSDVNSLIYKRAISGSSIWGTLMLPFDIETDEQVQLYELKKADFDNGILSFEQKSGIEANTPCVFKKKNESAVELTFQGGKSVSVKASVDQVLEQEDESVWTLKGTYEKKILRVDANGDPDENAADVFYISNNTFVRATSLATVLVNPYRAWFECDNISKAVNLRTFTIEIYDSSTGVKTVLNEEESAAFIYDLMGVKQSSVKSGKINIVNGKKSIVK